MQKRGLWILVAVVMGWGGVACDEHDHDHEHAHSLDEHICRHMLEGPALEVVAAVALDESLPDVSQDHTRYDVRIAAPETGAPSGRVAFASGQAGDRVIAVNREVRLVVKDVDGVEVSAEAMTDNGHCEEVVAHHVYPLGVGTYEVGITLDADGLFTEDVWVSVIIEAAAHADH